ncbi:MAG: DUF418 domain-containing protein [Parvularculaceae bacterium]
MLAGPRLDRFESLDVLRGVAVLGILAINIQAMAYPSMVFANPTLNVDYFDDDGRRLWGIASIFFQFKFITIFSALFGAGVLLMVGEEKPTPRAGLHRRRMLWLLLIGSAHAYLIWFGDILTPYAIAGFIVVFARRWKPRTLFTVGIVLIVVTFLTFIGQHYFLEAATPEERAAFMKQMWAPPQDVIDAEAAKYKLGFFERLPQTAPTSLLFQAIQSIMLSPRTIGVMMLGMALYKTGFFTLGWSARRYLAWGLVALAVGLAGSAYATMEFLRVEFDMLEVASGQYVQYWASLLHAFGYSALIMAACKPSVLSLLRKPFAAAGRMALTNYLMSSIIGAYLYYGPPGRGLIATQGYGEVAVTMLIVWAAMLVWSPIWLSLFRFGPFEWAWRSLTYWRLQPVFR